MCRVVTSSVVVGQVLDWSWERRDVDTVFRIGARVVGQLFGSGTDWSAVHVTIPSPVGEPVGGFRSRYAASKYLEQLDRAVREKRLRVPAA